MAAPSATLRVRGNHYPVLLPSARDPRLHLAATITSIQVMGQVYLGWELSIAQILVCLLTCAVIEVSLLFHERREITWPASALLTGNGVALVLRVNGTEHGDWWSMHGWYIFAATAGLALVSKHALRFRGRPVINPSNLGLVVCFLVLGTELVNPLDFWWGPMSVEIVAVYAILLAGGLMVTRRLKLLPMSFAFWSVFAASLGVVAGAGHCFSARWSVTPVCGADFWWVVVTSPEVLIFMLFMITDPMTSPAGVRPRLVFGASVGMISALLVAPMQTEFGAKVAVLAGLVVVCAARPPLAKLADRGGSVPAVARRVAATAILPVAVLSLVVLGSPARGPAAGAGISVAPGALAGRPDIAVPPGALPSVTVAAEVRTVIGDRAEEQAERMARDLVVCLIIEADAARTGDAELASSAIAGERLENFPQGAWSGGISFSAMEVVVVRDPSDPQAVPRLGIRGTGSRGASQVNSVYVLEEHSGTWMLTEERDAGSA